ncbi:MAG: DUF1049 domain-containing protein [Gammaproteobacteria bacterium]|nr:DUF1049 domain-containing protein [Gammaproteobacteria bacterium]
MPRILKLCIFLFIVLLGLVFHLRNDQYVLVDYYLDSIEVVFSASIVVSLAIGVALGYIVGIPGKLKVKRENIRLQKDISMSTKELNALRVIPVKDEI